MENLENRLKAIESRNTRVEADKAWESSWFRRGLLTLFTYLAISLYLSAIRIDRPWLNAIVPAFGFMISTLTMPFFKKRWLRQRESGRPLKTLKFRRHLVQEILAGRKTSTWRLFDDKDLQMGDQISLLDWETKETFATASISSLREKKLGEIAEADYDGHEKFASPTEMMTHYREYYGDRVTAETPVKIIGFKILEFKKSL